jgi:Zn-finger nucleic acid-binding protein
MNFMDRMEGEEIQIELKYCERCGGLWLRRQGADAVYCSSCRMSLEARPTPQGTALHETRRKRREQLTNVSREDLQGMARIDCLRGVALMEARG